MSDKVNFCGYEWECCMEGGRIIHPDMPYMYYENNSHTFKQISENEVELNVEVKSKVIKHWDGKTYYPFWCCGLLRSVNSFSYGTFSIEAKMPKGENDTLWPAIWLTGSESWPPEIDLMEGCTNDNGGYFGLIQSKFPWIKPHYKLDATVHYKKDGKPATKGPSNIGFCKIKDPTENFIEYKCIWKPESIKIYYDGVLVKVEDDKEAMETYKEYNTMNFVLDLWIQIEGHERAKPNVTPLVLRNFKYRAL